MILLTSSLTFGMASLALRFERGKQAITRWLAITLALGFGFLTLEMLDFRNMINAGAVPSRSGFWSSFWGLVPLHGLHVFAGCVWITIMIVQIQIFGMVSVVKTRIVRLGLFWHFLDLFWIGIFTIVYLGALAS
jgi:cytochrome o ubiquinol oxidase subunit 3